MSRMSVKRHRRHRLKGGAGAARTFSLTALRIALAAIRLLLALLASLIAGSTRAGHSALPGPRPRNMVSLSRIDSMSGLQFEQYVATLLRSRGYRVGLTPVSGDLGV